MNDGGENFGTKKISVKIKFILRLKFGFYSSKVKKVYLCFDHEWRSCILSLPGDQYVSDRCPLHRPVSAESEARLAVDVLRIADVRAIVALVDGHIYSRSFGVRLNVSKKVRVRNLQ